MSALFIVAFVCVCLGLCIGAGIVGWLRAHMKRHRPLRSRPDLYIVRTDHAAEQKRTVARNGFKSRMGAKL